MPPPDELDLDPVEPAPSGSRSKESTAVKPAAPRTKGGTGKGGDAPERTSVARGRKVPYPPSPSDVPDDLTDYADSYVAQQNKLLAGLFVFLIFYIGMILFFTLIGAWCVWSIKHLPVAKVAGLVFSGIFFLYLVKGFFKRHPMNKEMHLEVTEEEQPVLFEFIYQLCDELEAPLPNKVFVSPDVNAAVMPRTSLINLFVEPRKDLLIGLGLVNSVNLSEFKAVLAHEFGHFSQSAMASSYTYVASRIIGDLIEGEDWFDRMVTWCKKQDNVFAVIGHAIGAPLWVGRTVLEQCYKAIALQRLVVSREREFHADLVAVRAAGSNAVVHCLLRTVFGLRCFDQAFNDLATALDHKLYSNDLYLHQDRAAAVVRRKKKEPHLGLPPLLATPHDGKDIEVFDAEEEALTDEIPPMWRTHPSNSDREKNAKERFVPAVVDHRSPWVLFDEPGELRERMTYKFYRMVFRVPKNAELTDAVRVQKFIDNEHAETTYDPKYKGAYDNRPIVPGDLPELNVLVRDTPWAEERMEKVLDKLYDGCEDHAEARSDLNKELEALQSGIVGRPSKSLRRKIDEVEEKRAENGEWFKSFDRRVYLVHVQMAARVDPALRDELVERYRFQLEVQRFFFTARDAHSKAEMYFQTMVAAVQGKIQVNRDFFGEFMQALRESWKALKFIIRDAREINLPAMKNFEEGDNLAAFILVGKMVPEPPLSYFKGVWLDKLMNQLQGVQQKCARLHFKSLGGILQLQETIAARWRAQREPVAAEVLDEAPVPAEVVPAAPGGSEVVQSAHTPLGRVDSVRAKAAELPVEVIDAEVVPDEPIAAEVIEAEVLDAAVVPSEPLPAAQAHAVPPEPSKSMAAFMASPAPAEARGAHPPPVVHPPVPPAVPVQSLPSADPFDFQAPAPPRPAPGAAPAVDPEVPRPAPKLAPRSRRPPRPSRNCRPMR
ncbi:M48 family metallopeptidase [Frigoriglobus tundricola]|uniref:Peptidase M48 domain-containing protein n=1 Tax=Frigoriglobus tundricola TaxID=2774151 RepID=A0A6M5YVG1_9BACT|nr:M48 family metallopeptidase [Frigoriglobus tundricola]QJW97490.1 hypothetical protein FTUN_5064 [Frigoriglobus tundricola]